MRAASGKSCGTSSAKRSMRKHGVSVGSSGYSAGATCWARTAGACTACSRSRACCCWRRRCSCSVLAAAVAADWVGVDCAETPPGRDDIRKPIAPSAIGSDFFLCFMFLNAHRIASVDGDSDRRQILGDTSLAPGQFDLRDIATCSVTGISCSGLVISDRRPSSPTSHGMHAECSPSVSRQASSAVSSRVHYASRLPNSCLPVPSVPSRPTLAPSAAAANRESKR